MPKLLHFIWTPYLYHFSSVSEQNDIFSPSNTGLFSNLKGWFGKRDYQMEGLFYSIAGKIIDNLVDIIMSFEDSYKIYLVKN